MGKNYGYLGKKVPPLSYAPAFCISRAAALAILSLAAVCWFGSSTLVFAQGSWTTVAPMLIGHAYMGVTTGPDGLIYAIGGDNSTSPFAFGSNIAEAYNPATNTWIPLPSMPTARNNPAAASVGGLVYVIGGYSGGGAGGPLTTVEAYNPSIRTWTTMAPMPTARSGLSAVVGTDGKIYAIGGDIQRGGLSTNVVEAYDPSTNTWATSPLPAIPIARGWFGVNLGQDGAIYAIGGINQPGTTFLNSVEAYSVSGTSWTARASMPTPRYHLASAIAPNGTIYAIGGQGPNQVSFNTVEAYVPSTNTWSTAVPMPTAREGLGAATGSDGRIYAIGGQVATTGTILSVVEAFAPEVKPPPERAITFVQPPVGGNVGSVTVGLTGVGFAAGSQVKLTAAGQSDIAGTGLGFVNGSYLTTRFNLSGAAPGIYNVVLTSPDGSSISLPNGFTVQLGGAPQLWINILGRPQIRAGREQPFYLTFGNSGTVDAVRASFWVAFPQFLKWQISSGAQPSSVDQVGTYTVLTFDLARVDTDTPLIGTLLFDAPTDLQYAHQKFDIVSWASQLVNTQ